MNKTAIKNFAIWARNKLIKDIQYKAGLVGITAEGIKSPLAQSTGDMEFFDIGTKEPYVINGEAIKQRKCLVDKIRSKEKERDYGTAYDYVIEEVAYTWFNRLIAIRFMEVNDYLPSHVRVLSSESGKAEPDLVTTPFDADLEFTSSEEQKIIQLKQDNKLDELFQMLFIKQCNALNELLPELFEETADYTELLLNISFIDQDGIIWHLLNDIKERDFNIDEEGQVEIIGWLYQYYISEKHDQIINIYKGTVKKEDIPAATQLFTTDWVVRYMVDNSLGRYWIERNPESDLISRLEFFVTPKDGRINYIDEKIDPTDLTFFDPCMGSGHILVYAFDVLMEIYRECGYSDRDAALNIVQHNLYGMDIDRRAYQLAYFAVMMKARSYNRRALTQGIFNNLAVCEESNSIDRFAHDGITNDKEQNKVGEYLIKVFKDAKEIGTLQTIENKDYKSFSEYLYSLKNTTDQIDIFSMIWMKDVLPRMFQFAKQAQIMSQKYSVVCTNPPYMGKLEGRLKKFVIDNYKPYSGDLFSVFMYRNFDYCKKDGYSAFMTPNVWMFLLTYEKLREYIIYNKTVISLVQMAKGAFFKEATVDICAFILSNTYSEKKGLYLRLEEFKGDMDIQKSKVLDALKNTRECDYLYETSVNEYSKIPGLPIAYWVSNQFFNAFSSGKNISSYATAKKGLTTADDIVFLRLWQEVAINNCYLKKQIPMEKDKVEYCWFPLNKGGEFRRWYGNNNFVIMWKHNGYKLKNFKRSVIRNEEYYFKDTITWNDITSGKISFRYKDQGQIFNDAGPSIIGEREYLLYLIALGNTKVMQEICCFIAPTVHYTVGQISTAPVIMEKDYLKTIEQIAYENIQLSRDDWDSFEISWDYKKHPLVRNDRTINCLEIAFKNWEKECQKRLEILRINEEQLNRIFIDIYGLQEELTPEVDENEITVRKADLQRDIKSLLSYAVGCMFGRYSLDNEGLTYAGGEWDPSKYSTFIPDNDGIIPITDEEYFEDDIVGLFCGWLKKVYGADTLEENLDFIAKALGKKGSSSREIIRNYFLTDFFKDHCSTYSVTGSGKRPIYWLFDSGKQNGFKALIYLHRYIPDTLGNLRVDYLHRMQRVYESEINRMQDMIDHSSNGREVAAATKRKEKLQKQLKECREYDEKIGHLALSRIELDLDDGVKYNYRKVQTANDGKFYEVLAESKAIMMDAKKYKDFKHS